MIAMMKMMMMMTTMITAMKENTPWQLSCNLWHYKRCQKYITTLDSLLHSLLGNYPVFVLYYQLSFWNKDPS